MEHSQVRWRVQTPHRENRQVNCWKQEHTQQCQSNRTQDSYRAGRNSELHRCNSKWKDRRLLVTGESTRSRGKWRARSVTGDQSLNASKSHIMQQNSLAQSSEIVSRPGAANEAWLQGSGAGVCDWLESEWVISAAFRVFNSQYVYMHSQVELLL